MLYFTHKLHQEKHFKVVILDFFTQLLEEDINEDLMRHGYQARKIIRMHGENRQPALSK